MDARTGVERQPQAKPGRNAASKSRDLSGGAIAVVDAAAAWEDTGAKAAESAPRLSPDPWRSTDRYRLVMPYSARV